MGENRQVTSATGMIQILEHRWDQETLQHMNSKTTYQDSMHVINNMLPLIKESEEGSKTHHENPLIILDTPYHHQWSEQGSNERNERVTFSP